MFYGQGRRFPKSPVVAREEGLRKVGRRRTQVAFLSGGERRKTPSNKMAERGKGKKFARYAKRRKCVSVFEIAPYTYLRSAPC